MAALYVPRPGRGKVRSTTRPTTGPAKASLRVGRIICADQSSSYPTEARLINNGFLPATCRFMPGLVHRASSGARIST
jgi:hypothetical protein